LACGYLLGEYGVTVVAHFTTPPEQAQSSYSAGMPPSVLKESPAPDLGQGARIVRFDNPHVPETNDCVIYVPAEEGTLVVQTGNPDVETACKHSLHLLSAFSSVRQ
jgi:hypothetical protein